jgi:hypothetical protein
MTTILTTWGWQPWLVLLSSSHRSFSFRGHPVHGAVKPESLFASKVMTRLFSDVVCLSTLYDTILTPALRPVSKIRPSFFGREVKTNFNGDLRNQRWQRRWPDSSVPCRRRRWKGLEPDAVVRLLGMMGNLDPPIYQQP